MALKLRANEELKIKVDFHWSSYLVPGLWAFAITIGFISHVISGGSNLVMILIIGWGPLIYKLLANRCKDYSVTNQRLYVEEGIIAKKKKDIPLQKINDLEVSQGIIQRMLGSGNILVLTGNDKPTKLTNIDNPEVFKNKISEITGQISHKATSSHPSLLNLDAQN
ncbi:PH domain-containing protein [Silvanigrella paludirubra]|uniref:PH domain-containing protein n=1 Tax=Silvanigrella paludirubra TaxID=2499159 RepID=A0A6N6VWR8_9BACT|nr:PH domain-containing protein [Silvanigrella paludirubra]KAB8039129.1 PH domain-containing protein [Silvanigrella paludirubra]